MMQSKMQSLPINGCSCCPSVLQAALDSMHASENSDADPLEVAFEEQQVLLKGINQLFVPVFTTPCNWSCVKSNHDACAS